MSRLDGTCVWVIDDGEWKDLGCQYLWSLNGEMSVMRDRGG